MVNLKYDICNFTQLKILIEGTPCNVDPFFDKKIVKIAKLPSVKIHRISIELYHYVT